MLPLSCNPSRVARTTGCEHRRLAAALLPAFVLSFIIYLHCGICLLCVQADEQATVDPLAPKAKTNHKKTKTPLPSAQEDGTCPATHQVAAAKPQAPPAPTALSIATAAPAADDHGAAGTSEIEDDPVPDQQQQAVAVDVAQSFGADIGMKTPSPPATADGPHETQ